MEATTAECIKAREIAQLVLTNRDKIQDALRQRLEGAGFPDDVRRALSWAVSHSSDNLKVMFSGLDQETDQRAIDYTIREGTALLQAARIRID